MQRYLHMFLFAAIHAAILFLYMVRDQALHPKKRAQTQNILAAILFHFITPQICTVHHSSFIVTYEAYYHLLKITCIILCCVWDIQ